MACGGSTGQCLERVPDGFACPGGVPGVGECPVCCQPFAGIYGFPSVDTFDHFKGCFLGFDNDGQAESGEIREGRWCSHGCLASCDDAHLVDFSDSADGTRWLKPWNETDAFQVSRDAYGMFHDLRSNEYWPVPRGTNWKRGSCWYNDGRECFRSDVCACWDKGAHGVVVGSSLCNDVTPVGDELPFILHDSYFREGWGWPPSVNAGNTHSIGTRSFYCRQFADTRSGLETATNRLQVAVEASGGASGDFEGQLDPVHLSYSKCTSNPFVWCTGRMAAPDVPCETSVYRTRGPGSEGPTHDIYYEMGAVRQRFNYLTLDTATDPPRIQVCDAQPASQRALAALKNRVLDMIFADVFDGTRFDRLDSLVAQRGNGSLGRFERTWFGRREIPGVFGRCFLQQSGCELECSLHLLSIRIQATLVPEALKSTHWTGRRVELHARFLVGATLETEVRSPSPCILRTWDGRDITLGVDGFRVDPPLDRVELRDSLDRPVNPPKIVEWRGFLGDHSRPRSRDFRRSLGGMTDSDVCVSLANGLSGIPIPGHPMYAESSPDSPKGTYRGAVTVGFLP